MKNKNLTPYIIISLLVILLVGGVFFLKRYTPKYSWQEKLTVKNDEPYGISILYKLIKASVASASFDEIKSNDFQKFFNDNQHSTYIFIGSNYYIDSINTESLIKHISNGNKAFISSTNQIDYFLDYWLITDSTNNYINTIEKDTISTKLRLPNTKLDSNYSFYYQVAKKTAPYQWPYFDTHFFKLTKNYSPIPLSYIEDEKANFVSLSIGKGTLYLHTTPIFFSNYHLLKKQSYLYLQAIYSEISSNGIIWDSYSSSRFNNTTQPHLKESPLRFILKHKSLRWAWYLLLISILLFIIIQSKRKQNIIPLIKIKKNNTLEYAKAIGSLYFQGKNHKTITNEMMQLFYGFIKNRYNLKVGKEKDLIISRLSKVSGIHEKKISEIFKLEIKLKYDENAESEQLNKLYKLVDYFYKNCN